MLKILYDIEQLLSAKGKETGICRVSLEVLKELSKRTDYIVYPLVTIKDNSAEEYLKTKGLENLVKNIVYLPYLKKTTKCYNWRQKFKSGFLMRLLQKHYFQEISKYDEYISIFSPISPIVYDSPIKTKIIVHDLIPIKFPNFSSADFAHKYAKWIENIKADEVICVSNSTKRDFLEYRPDYDEKKVKVAYLAADTKFKPTSFPDIREKYGIQTEKYILSVSDHNPRKNFTHLIDSFAKFLDTSKAANISLVIVGPKARDSENIKNIMEKHSKYKDKIIITGYVADTDMPAFYTEADMFIYPSLYEGFGLPVLEAMQCGCPVICSNNSLSPEVGGNASLYISGTDIRETAEALLELYGDNKLKAKLEVSGVERAKLFSWKNTVNEIFN